MQNELYPELDTIYPGQEFLKHKMLLGCTNHLSDSVIYHVFKKLQLKTKNRKLNMNPFLKSNWSELLEIHGDNCKNGKLYYTLKISNENLNN